ncbi:hypothetical protein AB0M32_16410 [Streptomyces sp. NPDC051985]|uniref:hypothetical protein n=1 Tax=Streptomyces sp. NPDC051985 TaxID=3155807 RepID=UPI00342465DC
MKTEPTAAVPKVASISWKKVSTEVAVPTSETGRPFCTDNTSEESVLRVDNRSSTVPTKTVPTIGKILYRPFVVISRPEEMAVARMPRTLGMSSNADSAALTPAVRRGGRTAGSRGACPGR